MVNEADLVGLDEEQTRRFLEFDRDVQQMRDGIAAWHRLLDRRRLDRKRGLHPIAEFSLNQKPEGDEQGSLIQREPEAPSGDVEREPFYLHTESEARALLMRCIGYLTDAEGHKLASDKGYGERDKKAEWIIHEIREMGGFAYIARHAPHVFGIALRVASA
jgi:hypothetical protein